CRFKCGNGQIEAGEECDNGVNDGSYGTGTSMCKLAGYCGDGVQNGPEQCDLKDQNKPGNNAYRVGICTSACTFAPFCGDGRIRTKFGEECEGNNGCLSCKFTMVN